MADAIVLRISGDSQTLVAAVNAAKTSISQFNVAVKQIGQGATTAGLDKLSTQLSSLGSTMTNIGARGAVLFTAPIVAIGASAFQASKSFETAFAGVRKTFDDTGLSAADSKKQLDAFATGLRDMATDSSVRGTAEDLASLATQAQQLGISRDNLLDFTRTAAALADAVEGITPENAITGLAQLRNITRDGEADLSRMASSMTLLATRSSATNATILDFAGRIAGAGKEIGLTTPQILAISTSLSSVGLNAEAGGSAISRFFNQMQAAVEQGGDKLRAFAEVSGKSIDEFSEQFRTKPTEAVNGFLAGLQRAKEGGEGLSVILKEIGAESIREVDTLRRSTVSLQDQAKYLKLADDGWQSNNEHIKQSAVVSDTTQRKIEKFNERLREVGRILGDDLIGKFREGEGPINHFIGTIEGVAREFVKLPGVVKTALLGLGGITAITPLFLIFAGQVLSSTGEVIKLGRALKEIEFVKFTSGITDATRGLLAFTGIATKLGGIFTALEIGLHQVTGSYAKDAAVWASAPITGAVDAWRTGTKQFKDLWTSFTVDVSKTGFSRLSNIGDMSASTSAKVADGMAAVGKAAAKTAVEINYGQKAINDAKRDAITFADDLKRVGKAGFEAIVKLHKDSGREIASLATEYHVAESSINLFIKSQEDAGKALKQTAKGPLADFTKSLSELNVELSSAFENLTAEEIAAQFGARIQKMIASAKLFGKEVPPEFQRAIDLIDQFDLKSTLAEIRSDTNDTEDKLTELTDAANKARLDKQRSISKSMIEEQRKTAREREAIWKTSLGRELDDIVRWAEDFKRENQSSVDDLDAFMTSVDDMRDQKLANAVIQTNEFRTLITSVATMIPGAFGPIGTIFGDVIEQVNKTGDATDKTKQKTLDWKDSLDLMARSFAQLSQVAGGKLGGVFSTLSQLVVAGDSAAKSVDSIKTGFASMTKPGGGFGSTLAGIGSIAAGLAGLASTAIAVGKALYEAFVKPRWKQTMERVGRDFGIAITDGLSKQIEEDAKTKFAGDREAAKLFNFDKILGEGEITSGNIDKLMSKLHDVFSMVEQGHFTIEQARDTLDRTFPAFAEHIAKSGKLYSDQFREIIALNNQMGIESVEIQKFVKDNADKAASSLAAIFKPLTTDTNDFIKQMDEAAKKADVFRDKAPGGNTDKLSKKDRDAMDAADAEWDKARDKLIAHQDEVRNAGVLILKTFADAQASGMSYAESLQSVLPAIHDLLPALDRLKALGVDVSNGMLDQLAADAALVDKYHDQVDALAAVNTYLQASSAIGKVTQEQFDALAGTVAATAEKMSGEGFSQTSILSQMLPFLQEAIELEKTRGIKIDETTAKYIQQAKDAGLSLEKQKTETEVVKEGFDNVNLALVTLIDTLGGQVPEALRKLVDGLKDTQEGVEDVSGGIGEMGTKFDEAKYRGQQALDLIRKKAEEAHDAVDGLNFGSSPGGLKEIEILLNKSRDAFSVFERDVTDKVGRVRAVIDRESTWQMETPELSVDGKTAQNFEAMREKMEAAMVAAGKAGGGAITEATAENYEAMRAKMAHDMLEAAKAAHDAEGKVRVREVGDLGEMFRKYGGNTGISGGLNTRIAGGLKGGWIEADASVVENAMTRSGDGNTGITGGKFSAIEKKDVGEIAASLNKIAAAQQQAASTGITSTIFQDTLSKFYTSQAETPKIALTIQPGAFKQEVVTRAGTERDLMKQFIAPELWSTVRSGGAAYEELKDIVSDIVKSQQPTTSGGSSL